MKDSRNRYREDANTRRSRTVVTIVISCVVVAAICIGAFWAGPKLAKLLTPGTGASSQGAASPAPASAAASQPPASALPESKAGGAVSSAGAAGGAPVEIDKSGLSGYQAAHPDLYAKTAAGDFVEAQDNVIYLTFDDGPSALTRPLLDVLEKNNVKATFFLCCQPGTEEYMPLIREIYEQGSTCAVHSYCHDYPTIYASVDAFLDDFQKMYDIINEQTDGHCSRIFRFPGGSNAGPNKGIREQLLPEMLRRGFLYYDWDGDSEDASSAAHDSSAVYENVTSAMANGSHVILMHNIGSKQATLDAMEDIIQYGKANGYTFQAMPENLDPFYYSFTNKIMIPAVQDSPFFQPSDMMKAKYPDLFKGNADSGADSGAGDA